MRYLQIVSIFLLTSTLTLGQGIIEADIIVADSLKGNGSKITGIQLDAQNLSVSHSGCLLHTSNAADHLTRPHLYGSGLVGRSTPSSTQHKMLHIMM